MDYDCELLKYLKNIDSLENLKRKNKHLNNRIQTLNNYVGNKIKYVKKINNSFKIENNVILIID